MASENRSDSLMQTIKPGEKAFISWNADDFKKGIDHRHPNFKKAVQVAQDFAKMGVVLTGCSLDKFISRLETCPVCGMPGLHGE